MKQNITLSLDKEIIRQAKIMAAGRSTSISALLARELTRMVTENTHYRQARHSALSDLDQGFHLGGRTFDRESLYDRHE